MAATYKGPVCYVGHDHEAADGRMLEGGWHYTVIRVLAPDGKPVPHGKDESPHTMPGEKLVLDSETGEYRLAGAKDMTSHHAAHHQRLVIVAPDGGLGEPQTDEEFAATMRYLDELEARMTRTGIEPQESGHLMTTPGEVATMRNWLGRARR